jgi:hypothetical protein
MLPGTTEWKTLKVGVGAYAGQTVKLRIRQYYGTGLHMSRIELMLPGWQLLVTGHRDRREQQRTYAPPGRTRHDLPDLDRHRDRRSTGQHRDAPVRHHLRSGP